MTVWYITQQGNSESPMTEKVLQAITPKSNFFIKAILKRHHRQYQGSAKIFVPHTIQTKRFTLPVQHCMQFSSMSTNTHILNIQKYFFHKKNKMRTNWDMSQFKYRLVIDNPLYFWCKCIPEVFFAIRIRFIGGFMGI